MPFWTTLNPWRRLAFDILAFFLFFIIIYTPTKGHINFTTGPTLFHFRNIINCWCKKWPKIQHAMDIIHLSDVQLPLLTQNLLSWVPDRDLNCFQGHFGMAQIDSILAYRRHENALLWKVYFCPTNWPLLRD